MDAPLSSVWPIIKAFDKPQRYKHFIKSCHLIHGDGTHVGSVREVTVISGLPASTSTEKLEILDEDNHVISFSVVGGDHRLRNYRSVTSVTEMEGEDGGEKKYSVVVESYMVDVPEGNTEEDTKMFTDTIVKLNLQKLADVAMASGGVFQNAVSKGVRSISFGDLSGNLGRTMSFLKSCYKCCEEGCSCRRNDSMGLRLAWSRSYLRCCYD